jgi:opacity protein-like surface antigen
VNVVYGKKWQVGLFGGFTKNLGTNKPLVSSSMTYGMGMDIDKLYNMSVQTDYNIKNFTIGVEYSYSVADYGTIQTATGKVTNTHAADNHRIAALCNYSF